MWSVTTQIMTNERSPRRIQSVDTAIEILETIRDHNGLGLSELANEVGHSPSTAHTYLATMRNRGYVRKVGDTYKIGFYTIPLAEFVRSHSELYIAGKDEIDKLADETGEIAHLVIESHGKEIPIYEEFGSEAVGEKFYTRNKGYPRPNLHCSAIGKAILANLEKEKLRAILDDYEFTARTERTITDEQTLRDELETVREQGFAQNDEEQVEGLRAVGAVVQRDDEVLGGISLSAPTTRMSGQQFSEAIPSLIQRKANIVEIRLQTL